VQGLPIIALRPRQGICDGIEERWLAQPVGARQSMIRKSAKRFSEKIMLKQQPKAR